MNAAAWCLVKTYYESICQLVCMNKLVKAAIITNSGC